MERQPLVKTCSFFRESPHHWDFGKSLCVAAKAGEWSFRVLLTLRDEGWLMEAQSWTEPKLKLGETLRVCLVGGSGFVLQTGWQRYLDPSHPASTSLRHSLSRTPLFPFPGGVWCVLPGCWAPVGVGMGWRYICSRIMEKRCKREH